MKRIIGVLTLLVVLALSCQAFAKDTLVYSFCLARHGDRTPWSDAAFKNIHYKWPYALGELTPLGMSQEYNIGSEYRKKYIIEQQLLPAKYAPGTIYAVASAMNRTLMSAECLLTGLYPPGSGQALASGKFALPDGCAAIPIYSMPVDRDSLLNRIGAGDATPNLMFNAILKQPHFAEEQRNSAVDMKRWGALLGADIKNIFELSAASDYINCMLLNGASMPSGLSSADAEKLVDAGMKYQAEGFSESSAAAYFGGGLVKKINDEFANVVSGKQKFKMSIYLGHDISILPVMAIIGQPLSTNPPYAAHVEFDLYKTDEGKYFVKVTYNNATVKMNGVDSISAADFAALTRPYWI